MSSTTTGDMEYDSIESALLSIIEELLGEAQEVVKEGQRRLEELLNSEHDARIRAAFRINRETFYSLRN